MVGGTGGQARFFYPRLQAAASTSEGRQEVEAPLFNSMLHAKLRALPTVDPNDGETVLLPQLFPSTRREGVLSGYSAVDSSWRR